MLWATAGIGLLLLLSACAPNATQDTLQPQGPFAQKLKDLFIPVFWVAVFVFIVVEGGIVWITIRFRHRKGRERMPAQTHGNTKLEIGWTIAPALILAGVMVPTVATIWDLARTPPDDALNVTVEGFQWWWGFEYTDEDMQSDFGDGAPIRTADVLVIPEDRVVYLSLESAGGDIGDRRASDYMVIHSFWIPELAGKQDVVPGRTNHILMQADHPGMYTGQCAEFCGLQHGRMLVRVRALSAEDWDAWVANQKQPGVTPEEGSLAQSGHGSVPGAALRRAGIVRRVPRRGGHRGGKPRGTRAHPLRRSDPRVLRRVQLGHDGPRRARGLAPRPRRREDGLQDARLRPDRRGDRRPRRVPLQPDDETAK